MLMEPRIIYVCNHSISRPISTVITNSYVKSSEDTDLICTEGLISSISSIYTFDDNDVVTNYYEDVDFTIESDNVTIKWISETRPVEGTTFFVEFTNVVRETKQFQQEYCELCGGNGWYVALFDYEKSGVRKISGINKLIQEFIKLILTYKTVNYGSTLLDITGKEVVDDNVLASEIMTIILDCESQYKQLQLTDINSGTLMEDSEKLKSASLISSEIDRDEGGVFVSILLRSEDDAVSQINLMI